ncbi:MAG: hypothetical protein ACE5HF_09685 [Gemmatimonadota bacterium]
MTKKIPSRAARAAVVLGVLLGALDAPARVGAQETVPARGPAVGPDAGAPAVPSLGSGNLLWHLTTRGRFIDPLVTEHAFVDRKVRSDFSAHLLRDDAEGQFYQNDLIFEWAFTKWFSLEVVQPILIDDPPGGASTSGLGDLKIGAKAQLTRAEDTGGLILAAGLETVLPSGEEDVGGGDEYVVAPVVAADWAIGPGLFKLQSQGEGEIAFPRAGGGGELVAIEWNTALSYFGSHRIVPLVEFNAAFEGLNEAATHEVYAITPGVVVSLTEEAGAAFDIAAGAQIFFGSDREEDVAFRVSVRHHWPQP